MSDHEKILRVLEAENASMRAALEKISEGHWIIEMPPSNYGQYPCDLTDEQILPMLKEWYDKTRKRASVALGIPFNGMTFREPIIKPVRRSLLSVLKSWW